MITNAHALESRNSATPPHPIRISLWQESNDQPVGRRSKNMKRGTNASKNNAANNNFSRSDSDHDELMRPAETGDSPEKSSAVANGVRRSSAGVASVSGGRGSGSGGSVRRSTRSKKVPKSKSPRTRRKAGANGKASDNHAKPPPPPPPPTMANAPDAASTSVGTGMPPRMVFSHFPQLVRRAPPPPRFIPSANVIKSDLDEIEALRELDEDERKLVLQSTLLPAHESLAFHGFIPKRTNEDTHLLPDHCKGSRKKTLVLDMDETLVHCSFEYMKDAEYQFALPFGDRTFDVYFKLRPYVHRFIDQVSEWFDVVLFTSSCRVHAQTVMQAVDPKHMVENRLFRTSCTLWCDSRGGTPLAMLKDIALLGRDLKDVVIIDNSPLSFGFQLDNGIPIKDWLGTGIDMELLKLLPLLRNLSTCNDVRPILRAQYELHDIARDIASGFLTGLPHFQKR
eukprot:191134_1